jgi:hypothetical protein
MPSKPPRSWRTPGVALAGLVLSAGAAALFLLSACSVWEAISPSAAATTPPRPFNHEAHTVRGIACADCHEGAEKEARAGMPAKAFCMNCHEDIDKEKDKPLEKKVAWFLDEKGEVRWSDFGKEKADIKFSHANHAMKKVSCLECHLEMDKNTGLVPKGPQRMASCVACHQEKATAKLECSTCHVSIDRTKKPDNHFQLWTKQHGTCARQGVEAATANNCSLCHQPQACTICHQTVPPQDHNEFWRLRSHGFSVALDRSRCQVCHTTDSCVACHKVTAPFSHTAGWTAPQQRHCTGCHLPLQSSPNCATCHRDTPGHLTAPPKPTWHTANMICTSCHAATMKHPNNGDNCNSCHR